MNSSFIKFYLRSKFDFVVEFSMLLYRGMTRLAPAFLGGQLLAAGIIYDNSLVILCGVLAVVLVAYWHERVLAVRHPHVHLYDQDAEIDLTSLEIDEILDVKNYPLDDLLSWPPPPHLSN